MNRAAQAVVLTAIGGVALRVGLTDEYTRYINDWMRWPLVVSGLLVVALAFTSVLRKDDAEPDGHDEHDGHSSPRVAWALLIPVVVAFVVQPPALGSYVAERRVNDVAAVSYDDAAVAPLSEGTVHEMFVSEFVALAATYGEVILDRDVRLTGFVTRDGDDWFVTRLSMRCCAADASAFRVRVDGVEPPADETWVEVVGSWVEGTGEGADAAEPPAVVASEVVEVAEPRQQYE